MSSNLVTNIKSIVCDGWSWWWHGNNSIDEVASVLVTVLVVVLMVSWYTCSSKKSKKGKLPPLPPGPRGLPLVGNLPFLEADLHRYFAKLAKVYGPILKVKMGSKLCVVFSSPTLAKEVFRDHDATFSNRDAPIAALAITYGGLDVAWSPNGPMWRMLRKVVVREMLSNVNLDACYTLREQEVRQTVREVYANSITSTPINIGEKMFLTTLNVITSMLWGSALKGKERDGVGSEFRQVVGEIVELLGKPNVSDLFPVLARFDIQGIERRSKKLLSWFDQIFNSVIDQRVKVDAVDGGARNKESKDFLQYLLELMEQVKDDKAPLTITQVKALFMDIVGGGTDTTSIALEWAISEMLMHPEIMRKVQVELEEVVGMDNMVEESHLSKLQYLDAVVKETLRLHPSLPLLVPRCPSLSCTIGGYTVPQGTRIFCNVWAMQRDPEVWDNPLEFRPERFLGDGIKCDYSGNNFSYLPFGSGRRICAGISLAERTLIYVLASMLHSFELKLPEGTKLDLSEKFGLFLKKATPLVAIPTPRLLNPELYK